MFQFVVCARNVALGIFPTMLDALQAVTVSGGTIFRSSECYAEGTIRGEALTVVAVRADSSHQLFGD